MIKIQHVNSNPQETLSTNAHFIQALSKPSPEPLIEEWCGCGFMRPTCTKQMPAIVGIDYVSILLQTVSISDTLQIEAINAETLDSVILDAEFLNDDSTLFGVKYTWLEIGEYYIKVTGSIEGNEIEYSSGIFNVMPDERMFKNDTIVIETADSGYSSKTDIDYRTIGYDWLRMMRSAGGYDLAPHEIERTEYMDANRKHAQIFDSARRKFSAWVIGTIEQARMFEIQMLGTRAFIARHEPGKMDYGVKIPVVIDTIEEIREFGAEGSLLIRFACTEESKNNTKSSRY